MCAAWPHTDTGWPTRATTRFLSKTEKNILLDRIIKQLVRSTSSTTPAHPSIRPHHYIVHLWWALLWCFADNSPSLPFLCSQKWWRSYPKYDLMLSCNFTVKWIKGNQDQICDESAMFTLILRSQRNYHKYKSFWEKLFLFIYSLILKSDKFQICLHIRDVI